MQHHHPPFSLRHHIRVRRELTNVSYLKCTLLVYYGIYLNVQLRGTEQSARVPFQQRQTERENVMPPDKYNPPTFLCLQLDTNQVALEEYSVQELLIFIVITYSILRTGIY